MTRRRRREEIAREPGAPAPAEAPIDPRLAALRRAQQGIGNHALTRILARDPNPALEKRPAARPPRPKLRTGREVDAIFDASPYFKDLVGAKLQQVSLAKTMKLDDEATFERAWVAYAIRSYNPRTQANWTEEDARAFLAREGVRAFQDEDRGEVHIRKAKADLGTQLHEAMHLFADDKWRRRMDYNANEGVTEFFTRKLGPEVGVERDDNSFLPQYTSATHLVAAATEPVVAAAYFAGDLASLERAVDARAAGKGTWRRWLGLLEANDYKGANALMKGEAVKAPA